MSKSLSLPALIAIGSVVALYMAALILTGAYAWDDGTITLAFARTLADYGTFALNAASERVEGSSTPSFTLLMAAVFSVGSFSFEGMVMAGQIVTLICLVGTVIALNALLSPHIPNPLLRWGSLALFALLPMHLAEVLNGMEMTLFALVLVLFVACFRANSLWAIALAAIALLTRFEAIFYLGLALGLHFVFVPEKRRFTLILLTAMLATFAAITLARYAYFGDFLPNTVRAKMHAPYSLDMTLSAKLLIKSLGALEFISVNAGFILVLVAGIAIHKIPIWRDIRTFLILSFAAFAFVSGKVWGHDGRMFVAALPLFLWLIASAWPGPRKAQTVIAALVLMVLSNLVLIQDNFATIAKGMAKPVHSGITPEMYRQTGLAADALRAELGLEQISFLVPDVGGLALCCEPNRIRIVDIALLTNKKLASEGYQALPEVMDTERPDLIETHAVWSTQSGIYRLPELRGNYRPIIFRNTVFWLRQDHVAVLKDRPDLETTSISDHRDLASLRYFALRADLGTAEGQAILEAGGGQIRLLPLEVLIQNNLVGDLNPRSANHTLSFWDPLQPLGLFKRTRDQLPHPVTALLAEPQSLEVIVGRR